MRLQKMTTAFVFGSALMHVFCCGIPLLLAVTNLATLFGIAGVGALHAEWFEQFEVAALVIAGVMLVLTIGLQFISNRINCRTDGACVHEPCDSKKRFSENMLKFAVALYVVNLVVYFLSHVH